MEIGDELTFVVADRAIMPLMSENGRHENHVQYDILRRPGEFAQNDPRYVMVDAVIFRSLIQQLDTYRRVLTPVSVGV